MRYRFVSMESCPQDNFYSIITLEKIPGIVGKLFGAKVKIEQFRGNCTVWYNMKTGLRAGCTGSDLHDIVVGSTLMEGFLFNIWDQRRVR